MLSLIRIDFEVNMQDINKGNTLILLTLFTGILQIEKM